MNNFFGVFIWIAYGLHWDPDAEEMKVDKNGNPIKFGPYPQPGKWNVTDDFQGNGYDSYPANPDQDKKDKIKKARAWADDQLQQSRERRGSILL